MGFSVTVAEAVMLIAAVTAALILAAGVVAKVGEIRSSFDTMMHSAASRMRTEIKIVYATYNKTGGYFVVYAKNTGYEPVGDLSRMDVFFGSVTSPYPYWTNFAVREVNGNGNGVWDPGETIEIDIYNDTAVEPPYIVKIVTSTGASDTYVFSLPAGW